MSTASEQSPLVSSPLPGRKSRWLLWIVWPIDLLVALTGLYFFLTGLPTATVMSSYVSVWLVSFAVLAVILGGGFALHVGGHRGWAAGVLGLLAVPAVCFVLFFLFLAVSNPRWN